MANNKMDISSTNKMDLLKALWDNAGPMHNLRSGGIEFDRDAAVRVFEKENGNIDYLFCRYIKVDFSNDIIDPYFYDHQYGKGAFRRVFNNLGNRLVEK